MFHPAQVVRGVAYFWGGSLAFSPCRLQLLKCVQCPKQGTFDRGFVTREFANSVALCRIPPKGGSRALCFSPQLGICCNGLAIPPVVFCYGVDTFHD